VNKLLYGFIWKGNAKIKRTALINDIENGGLSKNARYPINDFVAENHCTGTIY